MSDEIEILIKRVLDSIRPSPLCRDCADCAVPTDMGDRCPHTGELCDSNAAAKEISQKLYKLYTKLEGTQSEDHGCYVENLLNDNAELTKQLKLEGEASAGLRQELSEADTAHDAKFEELTTKLLNANEANVVLSEIRTEQESYHQRQLDVLTEQLRKQTQAGDELARNVTLVAKLHEHRNQS